MRNINGIVELDLSELDLIDGGRSTSSRLMEASAGFAMIASGTVAAPPVCAAFAALAATSLLIGAASAAFGD